MNDIQPIVVCAWVGDVCDVAQYHYNENKLKSMSYRKLFADFKLYPMQKTPDKFPLHFPTMVAHK